MEEKGLSIGLLLRQSWQLFIKHWIFLIATLFVAGVVAFSPIILEVFLSKPSPAFIALLELVKTLLTLWMFLGLIKVYIALTKEEHVAFVDIFKSFPMVLNFLVTQILLGLMMFVSIALVIFVVFGPLLIYLYSQGQDIDQWFNWFSEQPKPYAYIFQWGVISFLVALFAPVLWIASRFLLVPFFIVDCYEGPIEALKMAYRASQGVTWDLFMLIILSIILFIIGFTLFGVGLLVTIPMIYVAQTYAYQELVETTPWKE